MSKDSSLWRVPVGGAIKEVSIFFGKGDKGNVFVGFNQRGNSPLYNVSIGMI